MSRLLVGCLLALSISAPPCWADDEWDYLNTVHDDGAVPSFKCKEKVSEMNRAEQIICADLTYYSTSADWTLQALYAAAVATGTPDSKRDLVIAQRAWLKERNHCEDLACIKAAYDRRIDILQGLVASQTHNSPFAVYGKTPAERRLFLKYFALREDGTLAKRNGYMAFASHDSDYTVRSEAAGWLTGTDYVPRLIEIIATDPSKAVRLSASTTLTHWLTDNGVEECQDSQIIEQHLQQLLEGLNVGRWTAQNVEEIASTDFCCFSNATRQRLVDKGIRARYPDSPICKDHH